MLMSAKSGEEIEKLNDEYYNSSAQETRRKLLRRAANRRSAQLSRARKKAHLEDLKVENSRLQRLVDILDSQPELLFCLSSDGTITYVSERSEIFMKINLSGDGSNEVPTHLSQILSKESTSSILSSISELMDIEDIEDGFLFSSKEVYFHDAFGYPLVGTLHCSKVTRVVVIDDGMDDCFDDEDQSSSTMTKAASNVPRKLQRTSKSGGKSDTTMSSSSGSSSSSSSKAYLNKTAPSAGNDESSHPVTVKDEPIKDESSGWNFSNLQLLTDYCVSSLTDDPLMNSDQNGLDRLPPENLANLLVDLKPIINPVVTDTNLTRDELAKDLLKMKSLSPRYAQDSTYNSNNNNSNEKKSRQRNGLEKTPGLYERPEQTNTKTCPSTNKISRPAPRECESREEVEFVCSIRTSNNCFAPLFTSKTEGELLLFDSQLSTASMVAHDLELTKGMRKTDGHGHGHGHGNTNKICDDMEKGDGTTESADSEESSEFNSSGSSGQQQTTVTSKDANSSSNNSSSNPSSSSSSSSTETYNRGPYSESDTET